MPLYLAIAFILFCLALLRLVGAIGRGYENALALCLTLIALIFSAIRWETGTDWIAYIQMYQTLNSVQDAQQQAWWGPAYAYISVLLNQHGVGFTGFLACIAVILFSAKYYAIIKTCPAPLVAIFILFCANFYDVFFVRESVAAVFFWLFAYAYYQRRVSTVLLYGVLSVAFHTSAALPIAIVLVVGRPNWKVIVCLLLLIAGGAYYVLTQLALADLLKLAGLAAYVGADFVEEKSSALATTMRAYLRLGYWMVVLVAGCTFLRTNRSQPAPWYAADNWQDFCLRCAFGIIVTSAILLPVSEIFARIPTYALPLFAVVLSGHQLHFRNMRVKDAAYVTLMVLLFVQLAFQYSGYADYYYPFKTIL